MRLTVYRLGASPPRLRPAPVERPWMDATDRQFAYRCLPLNIANACGWEVLCGAPFSAWWDGGAAPEAITIVADDAAPAHELPVSHFGHGVLTFHLNALLRTEPGGTQLWVGGPVNRPKDGIAPLTGIIETDWSPYTFTMNWLFTRPHAVATFAAGEPFCAFHPLSLAALEAVVPEVRALEDGRELAGQYQGWSAGRDAFNAALKVPGSPAQAAGWQKGYFRGERPDGSRADGHRTRLRLRPFDVQEG